MGHHNQSLDNQPSKTDRQKAPKAPKMAVRGRMPPKYMSEPNVSLGRKYRLVGLKAFLCKWMMLDKQVLWIDDSSVEKELKGPLGDLKLVRPVTIFVVSTKVPKYL